MKVVGLDITAEGATFSGHIGIMYADTIREHAKSGQMVPIVQDGDVLCWVNRRRIDAFPVPTDITAEDYILGLEVMGHSFFVMDRPGDSPMLIRGRNHEWAEPRAWRDRANALMAAFGRARTLEAIQYVRGRELRT